MDHEQVLAEVARRNTVAFEQVVRDLWEARSKDHETLALMHTALGNLTTRLTAMEQQLLLQKVRLTGLGPSVRE